MKSLIKYEFRKILIKKSTWITLTLLIVVTLLSNVGTLIGDYYEQGNIKFSKYEQMNLNRELHKELSGKSIDSNLINEMKSAFSKVPEDTVGSLFFTPEYKKFGQKYYTIYRLFNSVLTNSLYDDFNLIVMANLPETISHNIYDIRQKSSIQMINKSSLNNHSKEKLIRLEKKIKAPFNYEYHEGYNRYIKIILSDMCFCIFAIIICLAPLFSGEYTAKTDQIILSSKYGKSKLPIAKLVAGLSFGLIVSLATILITYFQIMLLWGSEGGNVPLQLLMPFSPYPLNLGDILVTYTICILMAVILMISFTMFLSSIMKTPYWAIIIASGIFLTPIFYNVSQQDILLNNIFGLLPIKMIDFKDVFKSILYEIGPFSIEPYIFKPIFALLLSVILLTFANKKFKKHQI